MFGVSGICKKLKGYTKAAKIEKTITVHSFRHTLATSMLQRGAPWRHLHRPQPAPQLRNRNAPRRGASVRHVQELLGHSSIDTTQIYTRVVIDDLQKSHNRTAPGNRRKEAAFIPFNSKTATWRQEKKRKRKQLHSLKL